MKARFVAILCLGIFFLEAHCFRMKAYFPPISAKRESRLILSGTLPSLSEVTVCHWVKAHSMKPKGMFIVSYAHGRAADELLTGVRRDNKTGQTMFILAIRNATVQIPSASRVPSADFRIGVWHHLCFTWSSGSGDAQSYLDGIVMGSASTPQMPSVVSKQPEAIVRSVNDFQGQEIRAGGVLIIGQDQDIYNGKFDLQESWDGFISDVQIWDEILTGKQIAAMAQCEQREGNVFAWMRNPLIAEAGVVLSRTSLCSSH